MMGLILDDGLALDKQMKRIALNEGVSFRLFSSTSVMRGLHVALDWPVHCMPVYISSHWNCAYYRGHAGLPKHHHFIIHELMLRAV